MKLINNLDELSNELNKLSIFSDKDEYMRLHEASIIDIDDIESRSELLEIINDAYTRYNHYLNIIEFIGDSKYIKTYIEKYIKLYKSNIDAIELFNMMKMIDSNILDVIHDQKEPLFWIKKKMNFK